MKSNYVSVEGDTLFNEPEKQTINFLELKPSLKLRTVRAMDAAQRALYDGGQLG